MGTPKAFKMIAPELRKVEAFLRRQIDSKVKIVPEIGLHLLGSGGKRIRPTVLLLSARLCSSGNGQNRIDPSPIEMAATMELIHTATLLHDDVVDNAPIRRGATSANRRWGNELSVLIGDYVLTKAFDTVIRKRTFPILDLLAKTMTQMAEGEAFQLSKRRNISFSEEDYLSVVERKTAMLISNACQVGAILAGAERAFEKALADYGYNIGMAFQIIDDTLDYTADEKNLGKTIGKDLKEGKLTLPLIAALRGSHRMDRKRIKTVLHKDPIENTDFLFVQRFIKERGGLDYAQRKAHRYIDEAKKALAILPDVPEKWGLFELADYVVERPK